MNRRSTTYEYSTVQPISPFDPMVSYLHYSVAFAQNSLRIIQGVCEIDHMAVWTFPKGDADWESHDKANFAIILQLIRKIMISDWLEYLLACVSFFRKRVSYNSEASYKRESKCVKCRGVHPNRTKWIVCNSINNINRKTLCVYYFLIKRKKLFGQLNIILLQLRISFLQISSCFYFYSDKNFLAWFSFLM